MSTIVSDLTPENLKQLELDLKPTKKTKPRGIQKHAPKVKATRKQAQSATTKAVTKLATQLEATTVVFRTFMAAQRVAVKCYFGEDLPEKLYDQMAVAIDSAVKACNQSQTGVDLTPIVEGVVERYKEMEAQERIDSQNRRDLGEPDEILPAM